jgi:hypothetical protein
LNPKAMDERFSPTKVYTSQCINKEGTLYSNSKFEEQEN